MQQLNYSNLTIALQLITVLLIIFKRNPINFIKYFFHICYSLALKSHSASMVDPLIMLQGDLSHPITLKSLGEGSSLHGLNGVDCKDSTTQNAAMIQAATWTIRLDIKFKHLRKTENRNYKICNKIYRILELSWWRVSSDWNNDWNDFRSARGDYLFLR